MARKLVKLPSLSRVIAGSKATLEFPIGPTYNRIIFALTGTAPTVAHIGRMDLLIDGKVIQTYKNLQRLFDLNSYYARSADTINQFALHLFRAELVAAQGDGKGGVVDVRRLPGIGTADVATMHMEIDIAAGAPADIGIIAYAEVDPTPQPVGVVVKVREFPYSSAVAGEVEISSLPRGPWYQAIHLFKADVSAVRVEANGVVIVDGTKAVLERTEKEASPTKRVPITASATHIDFCTEGDIGQSIKTEQLQDFRLKMTLATAGAVDIIAETLDTIQGA